MTVILFGLLAAFFFAAHSVAVKGGMKGSNPMTATLISSVSNTVFLWVVAVLFLPFDIFFNKGLIYLCIAGILTPSLARIFMYTGIEKVGVSITASIKETAQFFAAFVAIIFLEEQISIAIGVATIMTIMGVLLLSRTSAGVKKPDLLKWKKTDLIFPFGAAMLYGVSRFFRKFGMITVTSPWGGATVMATISLLFFPLIFLTIPNRQGLALNKKCFSFFALGGLLGGLGQVFALAAFKLGDVVIVGPLVSTAPFFSLLLTFVFLKKLERITTNVVMGAVLIVAAVIILTVFK